MAAAAELGVVAVAGAGAGVAAEEADGAEGAAGCFPLVLEAGGGTSSSMGSMSRDVAPPQ